MITAKRSELNELLQAVQSHLEIRPYNEKGEKDAKFNYIHRTDVAQEIINHVVVIEEDIL